MHFSAFRFQLLKINKPRIHKYFSCILLNDIRVFVAKNIHKEKRTFSPQPKLWIFNP